jgi:hypothetical protein
MVQMRFQPRSGARLQETEARLRTSCEEQESLEDAKHPFSEENTCIHDPLSYVSLFQSVLKLTGAEGSPSRKTIAALRVASPPITIEPLDEAEQEPPNGRGSAT